MSEEITEIKFPFKVSDKVIAAFKEDAAIDRTTRILVKAIYETAMETKAISPWEILGDEHPELKDCQEDADTTLTFSMINGTVRKMKKPTIKK